MEIKKLKKLSKNYKKLLSKLSGRQRIEHHTRIVEQKYKEIREKEIAKEMLKYD